MCRSNTAQNSSSQSGKVKHFCKRDIHWVATTEDYEHFPMLIVKSHGKNRPITVQLELNGQKVLMQVDTRADVSIIAEATQQNLFLMLPCNSLQYNCRLTKQNHQQCWAPWRSRLSIVIMWENMRCSLLVRMAPHYLRRLVHEN